MGMRALLPAADTASARLRRRLGRAALVMAALAALIGAVVLVGGWWLDLAVIRQPVAGMTPMRAGTAVGLVLSGIGIWAVSFRWPIWLQASLGGCVAALGVVVLVDLAGGEGKAPLEAFLALRPGLDDAVAGRISLNTTVCFVLLGVGLLLLAMRSADGLRQGLGMAVLLIGYSAIVGAVMSAFEVAGAISEGFTPMSPATAIPMMLLGSALVLASTQSGWGRVIGDVRLAGRLVRRGILAILVALLAAAWSVATLVNASASVIVGLAFIATSLSAALITALIVIAIRHERVDRTLIDLEGAFDDRVRSAVRDAGQAAAMLQVILDNSSDLIVRYGLDRRINYVNRRVVELAERPPDEWLGKTIAEAGYPPAFASMWDVELQRVLDTGEPTTFEYEIDVRAGHRWFETTIAAEYDEHGAVTHAVATSHDTTKRKEAEAQLKELATRDPLTSLANRAALQAELSRALSSGNRSGRPTAVLMLDLDRFKQINDSLGHAFGDLVLVEVANRLNHVVRSSDVVARPGGDEFIVVMRDLASLTEPMRAAERIIDSLRQPLTIEGTEIFTTASIGVTIATGAGVAEDMLREADTAMNAAKSEGRDRIALYNAELRAIVTERLNLENDLRRAVERDEFVVHYQPEVDFATGAVVAVEALLRWNHPDGRLRAAQEFIETAEETGIIREIGEWVVREACAQAGAWAAADPEHPLLVRINLSAVQLYSPTLLDTIDAALEAGTVAPELICFEITETALLHETVTVRANVIGIRDRGIQIAIDDFGTGFASLAYLRDYPVNALKIDRIFVTSMLTSEVDHRLIAGIIALANRFGVTVTAEGVEDQIQALELQQMGCPAAQGFLYSEAVPAREVQALVARTYAHS